MKTKLIAWAICDTDGGRHEPRPLIGRIYASHNEAEQNRKYDGYAKEYYPIMMVEITIVNKDRW